MPFTTGADAQALDALANTAPSVNLIAYASLHSSYSATGGNEITGGSPAYARVALTWAAANTGTGQKSLSATPGAFNVPASSTIAYVGLWSALTAGTFSGMGPNGGAVQYAFTASQASPASFSAPGTAYAANQTVVLFPGPGGNLPSPFTAGTVYYAVSVSGSVFSLSATSGGAGINSTTNGSGIIQAITLESYGAQGNFTLSADTLAII